MNEINQAAAALGKKGGKSTSEAKVTAARKNGAKGGRPQSSRKERADAALERLRNASPETRDQEYQTWLFFATAAEVRRNWKEWMGDFPGWAEK